LVFLPGLCFFILIWHIFHEQVIAARRGEFETGFERGGQTREHAQLAKTLGVSKLLVAVNKMDDPSVQWSKERQASFSSCFTLELLKGQ
jgi:translation elongation factor EF-1alpha